MGPEKVEPFPKLPKKAACTVSDVLVFFDCSLSLSARRETQKLFPLSPFIIQVLFPEITTGFQNKILFSGKK